MPTEEELQGKYQQMTTPDLLDIIARKGDYTELALSVAHSELKNRKVAAEEIKDHKPAEDPYKQLWMKNCLFDLNFFQKVASYFLATFNYLIGIVVRRRSFGFTAGALYSPGFKPGGFILKSNQYNYYGVVGFSFFILSLIFCQHSGVLFLTLWIGGFMLCFTFDILYNKQSQADKMQKIIEDGELPWGY